MKRTECDRCEEQSAVFNHGPRANAKPIGWGRLDLRVKEDEHGVSPNTSYDLCPACVAEVRKVLSG